MFPDWALAHRAKNVEVRNIRGRFYLYRVGHKYDPIKKQTKKITLEMLGVITEKDGLIPKGQSPKGRPTKEKKPILKREFGATNFLYQNSNDIISCLTELYPDHWQTLFVLSANRVIYQASLKRSEIKYESSFLSETMKEANLEKSHLTKLLRQVGKDRERIVSFLNRFIAKSNSIDLAEGFNGKESDDLKKLFDIFNADEQEMPFNSYKKVLDEDRSYLTTKESKQGLLFINQLATMMYNKILKQLKEKDMLDEMNPKEFLEDLAEVGKIKEKQRWELSAIPALIEKTIKKFDLKFR